MCPHDPPSIIVDTTCPVGWSFSWTQLLCHKLDSNSGLLAYESNALASVLGLVFFFHSLGLERQM